MKIGFAGIGTMGSGMAHNLIETGFEVVIFNRTRARAEALFGQTATIADTVAELGDCDVIMTMLTDDSASAAILFDSGLIDTMKPGAIHIESSTVSIAHAERLRAAHAERGHGYISAPVSGRGDVSRAGQLMIIAAGERKAFDQCAPIFDAVGRAATYFGEDPVAANVVKLAVNAMLAGTIGLMAETYNVVERWGIDKPAFQQLVESGILGSPAVKIYGGIIANESYDVSNFRASTGLKDVRLALALGEAVQASMPMTSAVRDKLVLALAQGYGDSDWAIMGKSTANSHRKFSD